MISPGAIGAGPATRPFYNRAAASGPPPTMAYTAKGVSSVLSAGFTVTIPAVSIGATDTLFIAVAFDNSANVDDLHVTFNGLAMLSDAALGFTGGKQVQLWLYRANGTPVSGDVVADFSTSQGQPTVAVMLAASVTLLLQTGTLIDKRKSASGTGTTQDSGLTATTTHAVDFVWDIIATNGNGSDTRGTWQAGATASQRVSTPGLDLKEAYALVTSTGTYRAEVTGATSRGYAALCEVYKGA